MNIDKLATSIHDEISDCINCRKCFPELAEFCSCNQSDCKEVIVRYLEVMTNA